MFLAQAQDLKAYNTFGIDAQAQHFVSVSHVDDVLEALHFAENLALRTKILGGGSNILLTKNPEELLLHNQIRGLQVLKEDKKTVQLRVGAGENWHQTVRYCVAQNWGGLENLSLIPGLVGASPIQNIGAYGTEVKECIMAVHALDLETRKQHQFSNKACAFDYRDSFFKSQYPGRFYVFAVDFKLNKWPHHALKLSYGSIKEELDAMGCKDPGLDHVSQAVMRIRSSKLPDPKELGNSGSFFKNPVLNPQQAQALLNNHPDAPHYPHPEGVKFAAGWLIEQSGWKGKRHGKCGVHARQALVLVNYGGATGQEVYALSEAVMMDVYRKFGVSLEREVNVW